MARRSSSLGWLATVAVLGACSGSPTGTTDGGGGDDGGVLPGFDAPPPTGLFPLGVAADGATLVTGEGKPFLLHGEAAWSLIVQLNTTDAMRYLADRKARGINAVIVNLIEHYYSSNPPRNAAGAAPFTTAGDFSRPNEAYFAHADQVIDLAASQGMVVLLTPSYLGFLGGSEGWYQDMTNLSEAKCSSYGNFLGTRYASRHNIIWVWGGDYTPPSGRGGEACLKAIRDGIRAAEPAALATAHWDPETTSRDEAAFTGSIDLVGVYTYQPVLPACRAARAVTPRKPIFLFETCYEQETIQGCAATTANVRRRQWWGWLGCGAGEFVGNKSIWKFDSGIANDPRSNWIHELTSPATLDDVRMSTLAHQMAWQTLEIDDALITGGQQAGYKEITAARTADHKQALIYIPPDIPPDGSSTITVDLDQMNGSVTATWLDPTSERSVAVGTGLTGSRQLTTPGNNDDGDDDWVLRLSVP